jgi:CRP-like cAMP-binding protein
MAMLGSRRRDLAARARGKVRLARVNADSFGDLLSRSTEFSLLVMRTLAGRLRAADQLISEAPRPTRPRRSAAKSSRPMDLLELFTDTTDLATYPAGSVIIEHGTRGDTMFVVVEGEATISLKGRDLAIAGPGEIVGEMALLSSDPRSATVTARTDCRLATIDQASFEVLLRTVPHFAGFVMSLMASRLRQAYKMVTIPPGPELAARSR